jgi:hypothetical protein
MVSSSCSGSRHLAPDNGGCYRQRRKPAIDGLRPYWMAPAATMTASPTPVRISGPSRAHWLAVTESPPATLPAAAILARAGPSPPKTAAVPRVRSQYWYLMVSLTMGTSVRLPGSNHCDCVPAEKMHSLLLHQGKSLPHFWGGAGWSHTCWVARRGRSIPVVAPEEFSSVSNYPISPAILVSLTGIRL